MADFCFLTSLPHDHAHASAMVLSHKTLCTATMHTCSRALAQVFKPLECMARETCLCRHLTRLACSPPRQAPRVVGTQSSPSQPQHLYLHWENSGQRTRIHGQNIQQGDRVIKGLTCTHTVPAAIYDLREESSPVWPITDGRGRRLLSRRLCCPTVTNGARKPYREQRDSTSTRIIFVLCVCTTAGNIRSTRARCTWLEREF